MSDIWATVATERRALADLFEGLGPEQWQVRSLCPAWTVHDMAAHLVSVLDSGARDKVAALVAGRGLVPRVTEALAARYADRSPAELVALLRRHADSRFRPPGAGPRAPLTDLMVHRLDVAVPLGIDVDRPLEPWGDVLDFLVGRMPTFGVLRPGRPAAAWVATDLDWRHGSGPEVRGPAAALGTVLAGRAALVGQLEGPGLPLVRAWVEG